MTQIQSFILGIVQGLTEFLPISSSAHLVLIPRLFGWNNLLHQNPVQLTFDIILHLGSLLALLIYFKSDLLSLIKDRTPQNNKLLKFLVIGTIPAFIIGLCFNGFFERLFGSAEATAIQLVITGVIIFIAEYIAKLKRNISMLNLKDSVLIGIAQAVAIIPGISRSGATISTGLFLNLDREAAARFSFLLAIPAIFGAFIFSLKDASTGMLSSTFAIGLISSFIFSYLAIKYLLRYLQKGSLKAFALYCIVVGLVSTFLFHWHII